MPKWWWCLNCGSAPVLAVGGLKDEAEQRVRQVTDAGAAAAAAAATAGALPLAASGPDCWLHAGVLTPVQCRLPDWEGSTLKPRVELRAGRAGRPRQLCHAWLLVWDEGGLSCP